MTLPFAAAAEQNKIVIYEVIKFHLVGQVLEFGSGTGQHAVYFSGRVPGIYWQTSDLEQNLTSIAARIDASGLTNLPSPLELDVLGQWPESRYNVVYGANCFHIMGQNAVENTIKGAAACLLPGGCLIVYGPFNYQGRYTSASNARFDQYLMTQDPVSGLRDFEWLDSIARRVNLRLLADHAMPQNNRCLIWKKRTL